MIVCNLRLLNVRETKIIKEAKGKFKEADKCAIKINN